MIMKAEASYRDVCIPLCCSQFAAVTNSTKDVHYTSPGQLGVGFFVFVVKKCHISRITYIPGKRDIH